MSAPHSVEAEQAVIGSLLYDNRAWCDVGELAPTDFYRRDHQIIFAAIAELAQEEKPFDAVTVGELLERKSQSDQAGGLIYLAGLVRDTPSAANASAYAHIVRERAKLRRLSDVGNRLVALANDSAGRTSDDVVAEASVLLSRAAGKPNSKHHHDPQIKIRNAAEVAQSLARASWVLRPFLELDSIAILYGDYGTYKSFIAIDWALRIALGMPAIGHAWPAQQGDVVLISAEGRALPQRLRGWCLHHCPGEEVEKVLMRASLYCIEHPINLSDPVSALALVDSIERLMIVPRMVIIDTMSRNSDGRIENSTSDAAAYLATVDQGIRARYKCGVLLTHHVGHVEKGRMRGPIVLAANTDALIRVERPDPLQRIATVTVDRLKDSELPAPQGLRADVVELGELDQDDQIMTTLALASSDVIAATKPQQHKEPTGARGQLLAALKAQNETGRIWTTGDIRKAATLAGIHRNSARRAVDWIITTPLLTPTVGGWRLNV